LARPAQPGRPVDSRLAITEQAQSNVVVALVEVADRLLVAKKIANNWIHDHLVAFVANGDVTHAAHPGCVWAPSPMTYWSGFSVIDQAVSAENICTGK